MTCDDDFPCPIDDMESFPYTEGGGLPLLETDVDMPFLTNGPKHPKLKRAVMLALGACACAATAGGSVILAGLALPDMAPHSDLRGTSDVVREFERWYLAERKHAEYAFGSGEYMRRFDIYKANREYVNQHNRKSLANKLDKTKKKSVKTSSSQTWSSQTSDSQTSDSDLEVSLRLNKFADLTFGEFKNRYLTAAGPSEGFNASLLSWNLEDVSPAQLPDRVNWHDRGCVTPVKDQAKCGSCWAFSSTGAIEGAVCAKTGQPAVSLSEQQLIDCAGPEGEHGCNGGLMDRAFQYVKDADGLCREEDYPYHAMQGECRKCDKTAAKVRGFMRVPTEDEAELRKAVALYGPVAAAIEADRQSFQFYHTGVFNLKCGHKLNHAILVTGYGGSDNPPSDDVPSDNVPSDDDDASPPYWLVKNSWGATWGDHGYVRLARHGRHGGHHGECGVMMSSVVPVVY